jgi:hypothetical protein
MKDIKFIQIVGRELSLKADGKDLWIGLPQKRV